MRVLQVKPLWQGLRRYSFIRGFSTINKESIPNLPLFQRAVSWADRVAIVNYDTRKEHTYSDLLRDSGHLAGEISQGKSDMEGARVSFISPASYDYVRTQWAIWRAGGVAVPLCTTHPAHELEHVIKDSQSSVVVASSEYQNLVKPLADKLGLRFLLLPSVLSSHYAPKALEIEKSRRALMIYTSGTTGPPKGVVTTHAALEAQVTSLVQAWEWVKEDNILQVLPLHHVHGVVNVVTCALWSGATCEMMPKFDADKVWKRFMDPTLRPLTLFMAVPTIYSKLIKDFEEMDYETQEKATKSLQKLRLMVSGSAALPTTVMEKWKKVSGHTLLERYGMTEIGMALSNPLKGERVPGTVGYPLPGVQVRIVDGELRVKGPQVFQEYLNKPEATKATFDEEGWFKTGDIVEKDETGRYKILGRASVDIIKSGGFKISALDIERDLLEHPDIADIAVVGIPDEEWGQVIGAIIAPKKDKKLTVEEVQNFAKKKLASYKIPRKIIFCNEIPKNALGKVSKKPLVALFQPPN
eukprot:Phypoly_transcript_05049.p1 GENE.Phypoly_transcript_05049~~Phypoly_transcript_05049.p1  ORF type:complete len:550 (+),score=76.05 Phypoly_transcript_05049:76-1650(+)